MTAAATSRLACGLAATGAGWAALCLLDPAAELPCPVALLLAAAGVAVARRSGRVGPFVTLAAILASLWSLSSLLGPNLGADSRGYFAYLRSFFFDGDIDLTNEGAFWGWSEASDQSWHWHPVGPAVLWSPFYLVAHAYVILSRFLGRLVYEADGFSAPYLRATALGTITVAVAGAWLLSSTIHRLRGRFIAGLSVAGATLASSTVYYLLVQPTMAHGLTFGIAAALVWAWYEAERLPSLRSWLVIGVLIGLLTFTRWQAVVYVLMFLPLAAAGSWRGTLGWRPLVCGALVAVVCFSPQMVVWTVVFGTPLTVPQGTGFIDWSSPHFVDTFISADRGLLTWTPVVLLGLAGLVMLLRGQTLFALGALLVVFSTAWLSGGVPSWNGDRSYAARRFVLIVPLVAVGLAAVIEWLRSFAARRPLAVPTAAVVALVVWNLGFMRLYQRGVFSEAAPFERVMAAQAGQLREIVEGALETVGGPRARSLGYKAFVGEYFWDNVNLGGQIQVGGGDARYLLRGWSQPKCRNDWPRFRWALHPESCVGFPLAEPFDLRTSLMVRSRRRFDRQSVSVVANGKIVAVEPVPAEWTEVRFTVPAAALVPGENRMCFQFSQAPPDGYGERRVAAVAWIQLP